MTCTPDFSQVTSNRSDVTVQVLAVIVTLAGAMHICCSTILILNTKPFMFKACIFATTVFIHTIVVS